MTKYYRLLKDIPCGYIKGHLFRLKDGNLDCSWKKEQKDNIINWTDDSLIAKDDLQMTEYFEESVGMSSDGYILFDNDIVYGENAISFALNKPTLAFLCKSIYFKKENIPVEKILPKSWNDLNTTQGYYVVGSKISSYFGKSIIESNKNVFKTELQAKSALAFAQLSQLIAEMNEDSQFDWENVKQPKYSIVRFSKSLMIDTSRYGFTHLPFHKKEHAEFSLINHKSLWETFYELTTTE